MGELGILNVGDGDTKLSFDPKKPKEVEYAKKVVTDLLRRGFAILIEVGKRNGEPLYQRAHGFDPETCEYIIVGAPEDSDEEAEAPAKAPKSKAKKAAKPKSRRVAAHTTRGVAVARSAGG